MVLSHCRSLFPVPPSLAKVVLTGDQRVGKTTQLSQWAHGEFREEYEATVSPELTTKEVTVAGKQVRLQVWDTGFGEPLTASQFPVYLKGASGALLLYDLTKNSFYRRTGEMAG